MEIKQQIETKLNDIEDFALADAGTRDVEDFRKKALSFLRAKTYGEAAEKAKNLMKFTLDIHAKTKTMGPIIKSMLDFELNEQYDYNEQRVHYLHSANNLLLGLYLYHGCSLIKNAVKAEMERTSVEKEIKCDGDTSDWQYSGGSVDGEFFYRWRLCSLCHDIGYPISLSVDNRSINAYLSRLKIKNLAELTGKELLPNNRQLLEDVLNLKTYIDKKEANPGPGKEKYDHGIMGGLIFLYKMDELFSQKPLIEKCNGKKILWDRVVYNTSLREVANAVAMHNLEMNEIALNDSLRNSGNRKIYDIHKNALSWLLKVTDILQEWDKPKAKDYLFNKTIPKCSIEIETTPKLIKVKGFDSATKDKINEKLNNYFKQTDFLELL